MKEVPQREVWDPSPTGCSRRLLPKQFVDFCVCVREGKVNIFSKFLALTECMSIRPGTMCFLVSVKAHSPHTCPDKNLTEFHSDARVP